MNYLIIKIGRKSLCTVVVIWCFCVSMPFVFAQEIELTPFNRDRDNFELIPKVDDAVLTDTYNELSSNKTKRNFWEAYSDKAKSNNFTLDKQLATGVMNRDSIIGYAGIIIQFISSLGLVVGAGFIIYSGYQYALSAFGAPEDKGKAIKNAFIGIAIITTSYGIFRLLYRIFIE